MDLERIDHVAIAVIDFDESIKFYTETLGMKLDRIVELPEYQLKIAFVTKDGADIELMKYENPTIPVGVRHICVQVQDVQKSTQELIEKGVNIIKPLSKTSLGFSYAMFTDPNGVTLELLDATHKSAPGVWRPEE